MHYLATGRARARRADPRLILPECKSILVLAIPYSDPSANRPPLPTGQELRVKGRVAAYAWGDDYHLVLRERLQAMVTYIESQVGHPVTNRWYTDTGPILERDLAQRAGLGWIGKNTCLINPKRGSYFLLAEILLGLELEADTPFSTDHCGTCTRCLDACPTDCILPDRIIDAGRCISYLTIELRDGIPPDLRPQLDNWIFGCDICQAVCPWNRFAPSQGDPAFRNSPESVQPALIRELQLAPAEFKSKFKHSPVRRARLGGYLRNVAVALGNTGTSEDLPALEEARKDGDPLVREHAAWAIERVKERNRRSP